jgi:hypothetical protein
MNTGTGKYVIVCGKDIYLDNMGEHFTSSETARSFAESFFEEGTFEIIELKFIFLP